MREIDKTPVVLLITVSEVQHILCGTHQFSMQIYRSVMNLACLIGVSC